jgi:hypothetical protein
MWRGSVPLRGLWAESVDLVTSPGEDLDFSCMSRAFTPALDGVVRAGNENTRRAGARQDSHVNDAGAAPIRNWVSMSPCVAQRYWYPAMTPLGWGVRIYSHMGASSGRTYTLLELRQEKSGQIAGGHSACLPIGHTTTFSRDVSYMQATLANVRGEIDRGGLRGSEIYSGERL